VQEACIRVQEEFILFLAEKKPISKVVTQFKNFLKNKKIKIKKPCFL